MQLAIELPDELGRKVLQHSNVQQFVQTAIERLLLEEARTDVPPLTKSLIGLLGKTPVDESDYKKHLEEKYL
ncbi:MAG: hypothetical protein NTV00_03850 [Methylococcales bacterium]|nr:hypothetical protein [Methylococcales bacterium]